MTTSPSSSTLSPTRPRARPRLRRGLSLRLPPTWPLTVLLVGYPVLWALGLTLFALQILAVPMAFHLWRRRPIRLPPGFWIWALFLVVSSAGLLVLGVNPDDTVPGSAPGRLVGYAVRQSGYVAATVLLLYVGNLTARELSNRRVVVQLGVLFLAVTAGGVAGLIWPTVSFPSPVGLLLPEGIAPPGSFIHTVTHPSFAQVQEFSGEELPRPSAPYAYTNTWGSQISLLAIWFAVGWLALRRRAASALALVPMGIALVTVIYSLNRGVWLGIVLTIVCVMVALALRGRILPLAAVLLVSMVVALLVAQSPLRGVLDNRLDNGKSDNIRAYTSTRAVDLATSSPVIGYGTTRSAVGSPSSIAVGKSSRCPTCGNVPLGINGTTFTLLVTTGWLGTALFWTFWLHQGWRSRRDRSLVATAARITLVVSFFYSFFYTLDLLLPFLAMAMLWRAEEGEST